jgi:hypothetical protein
MASGVSQPAVPLVTPASHVAPRFNTAQLGSEFFLLNSSPKRVGSHHIAPSWALGVSQSGTGDTGHWQLPRGTAHTGE